MHTLKGVLWFGVLGVPALAVVLAVAGRLAERRRLGGVRDAAAALLWDPSGKGRPMKEWVQVPFAHAASWTGMAAHALAYVGKR